MNILITNDDGIGSTGLEVLREAARRCYPSSSITTIVPETQKSGASMSTSPGWEAWKTTKPIEYGSQFFSVDLSPADLITKAFLQHEEFHPKSWDLVLVGINPGMNLGFDVFHSGTCGIAMIAATAFGTAAWAFSADVPNIHVVDQEREDFDAADRVVRDFMRKTSVNAGECFNVNVPKHPTQGYRTTEVAHYSYHRRPPIRVVPRARNEESDITAVERGFVSITELRLRVNKGLSYV